MISNIVLSAVGGVLACALLYKIVHLYQRRNYDVKEMMKDIDKEYSLRLVLIAFISSVVMIVCYMLEQVYTTDMVRYIGLVFYITTGVVVRILDSREPQKTPLKYTPRIKRLYVTMWMVCSGVTFAIVSITSFAITLSVLVLPVCIVVSALINTPMENIIKARYIRITKKKLDERPDLIKIGITGSFGKTSVKNILASMLATRYRVLVSPLSYNTPMGICRTVGGLDLSHEILICEMGARHVGDIRELCDIVHPTIAVITGITTQHMETFLTLDNIITTKRELIESLPQGGEAYVNGDTTNSSDFVREGIRTTVTGDEEGKVCASDIEVGSKGSTFTLRIGKEKMIATTKLLGKHNISNIVLASSIAYSMGVPIGDIVKTIDSLEPTPHRLEILRNPRGINIIDDTFNANVEGAKRALEVLALFKGRKIVLTPGMVELGDREYESNFALGKDIGDVCDMVLLVGEQRTTPIREGLKAIEYDMAKVKVYGSLLEAKEDFNSLLKRGDTLLMLNDLPDEYTEHNK